MATNWMRHKTAEIRPVRTVQISAASLPGGDFIRFAQDIILEHLKLDGHRDQRGLFVALAYCASEEGHRCPPRPDSIGEAPQCPEGMDIEPPDPDEIDDWSWPDYAREVAVQLVKNLPALPITELIEPGATVDNGYLGCEVAAALLGVGSEDILEVEKQTHSLWIVSYLAEAEGQDGSAGNA